MGMFLMARARIPVAQVLHHHHHRCREANRTLLITNGITIPISLRDPHNPNSSREAIPTAEDSQMGTAKKPIHSKQRNIA
jgi:hypothetical protein